MVRLGYVVVEVDKIIEGLVTGTKVVTEKDVSIVSFDKAHN